MDPPLEGNSVYEYIPTVAYLMTWQASDWVTCIHCPQNSLAVYTIIAYKQRRQMLKYAFLMQNKGDHFDVTRKVFYYCG